VCPQLRVSCTERSGAVPPGDPVWLLYAIKWVMSAERDFLVSTDTRTPYRSVVNTVEHDVPVVLMEVPA